MSKSDEIQLSQDLDIDLSNTWTCYNGPNENGEACGSCPACIERLSNFKKINIQDPIKYAK